MFNIGEYISRHKVEKINIGFSGADVYSMDDRYILKHVVRSKLRSDELFLSYKKEALFYRTADKSKLYCLPEVNLIEETDEELVLLMKKYRMIEHREVNHAVLSKIMKSLAMVHHYQVPDFLMQNKAEVKALTNGEITSSVNGWLSVLREHKSCFDEKPIEKAAASINSIVLWHASGKSNLIHGDFHLNNLLFDEEGGVLICDWQGVSEGNSSNDLSFF